MDIKEVINQYVTVQEAKDIYYRAKPVIDILSTYGANHPITVREIGEKIMGEKYNEKVQRSNRYQTWTERTPEAKSLTGTITWIFRKLVDMGLATKTQKKDMEHPYTYEDEDYVYFDKNGNVIPEVVELNLANGKTIKVFATSLPEVTKKWSKFVKTGYPTVTYYTLK